MEFYTCKNKFYDKNNVIRCYQLQNLTTGQIIEVEPMLLKEHIYAKKVNVNNLKLTSDFRLIDKNLSEQSNQNNQNIESVQISRNINQVLNSYQSDDKVKQKKLSYVMEKLNSKRVGKVMSRALLMGMMCATVLGTTACSSAGVSPDTISSIEQTVNNAISTLQDKLDNAKVIRVDANDFASNNKVTIYADDEEVGQIGGDFKEIYNSISFTTKNGEKVATGDTSSKSSYDGWAVYDENGNFKYGFDEDGSTLGNLQDGLTYNIYDNDKNIIATLEADVLHFDSRTAKIVTPDGTVVAKITQEKLNPGFKIEVLDETVLDTMTITTVATNHMMQSLANSLEENLDNSIRN